MGDQGWLLKPEPRPGALVKLYCLPSAGCGPSMYFGWGQVFPQFVEIVGVGIPGHESLIAETLSTDLCEIAGRLLRRLVADADRPYALFGHSMGAWLAYELTRQLSESGHRLPIWLGVSGRRSPQLPKRRPDLQHLPDADLIEEVQRRYGGIRPEVMAEPELLQLFLPILRADLMAVENYKPGVLDTLGCPITAFGGANDDEVSDAELAGWGATSKQQFSKLTLPGGHFYLQEDSQATLVEHIATSLQTLIAPPAGPPLR